ncbi:hypothetical protein CE91St46_03530 [Eubacteriales bacterium]|nr:hypothetical protein [Faecalicatena sp. BF-R-105]GKH49242.1 hypothetical protein CE91St46_03530 [Eubacteriales bacterium]GKH61883.1 hypothetical protein CE91St47_03520 [Eubacteriales bacterium]
MKIRISALLLAATLLLAACGSNSSSAPEASSGSESAPSQSSAPNGGVFSHLIRDGKFVFTPVADAHFTMEYEPPATAVTGQHIGLDFLKTMNTDWLGDQDFIANYTLYDGSDAAGSEKKQYGTVAITTAPPDLAEYYGTSDPAEQLERMKAHYFPAADVFVGRKKAVVEDFGYDLVFAEQATFEALGWDGFFIEFIDPATNTRSMRFFLCNDEMNEKYYSFAANVDLPADDEELADRYRATLFSLKTIGE